MQCMLSYFLLVEGLFLGFFVLLLIWQEDGEGSYSPVAIWSLAIAWKGKKTKQNPTSNVIFEQWIFFTLLRNYCNLTHEIQGIDKCDLEKLSFVGLMVTKNNHVNARGISPWFSENSSCAAVNHTPLSLHCYHKKMGLTARNDGGGGPPVHWTRQIMVVTSRKKIISNDFK